MFENVKNVKTIFANKENGLAFPFYELDDIPVDEWNDMVKRQDKRIYSLNSRDIAEMVEKRHADLIRDIRTYIRYMEESNERKIASVDFFIESQYCDPKGEMRLCYEVTKMGCEMIANKLTGRKGIIFTANYVKKFNEMEGITVHKPDIACTKTLGNSIDTRIKEVNALHRLAQASTSSEYRKVLIETAARLLLSEGGGSV